MNEVLWVRETWVDVPKALVTLQRGYPIGRQELPDLYDRCHGEYGHVVSNAYDATEGPRRCVGWVFQRLVEGHVRQVAVSVCEYWWPGTLPRYVSVPEMAVLADAGDVLGEGS